jgi:hypothetical protein
MIVRKVRIAKKIGDDTYAYHPESDASVIIYEDNLSVKDALDSIVESIEEIENTLTSINVYMQDDDGSMLTDMSGVGLVRLL